MKKALRLGIVLLIVMALFTGCLTKEGTKPGSNVTTKKTLSEVRKFIVDNSGSLAKKATDTITTDTFEFEGIATYIYTGNSTTPTSNYIYVIDENGLGLKLTNIVKATYDGKFKEGSRIKVTGNAYYNTSFTTNNEYSVNVQKLELVKEDIIDLNKATILNDTPVESMNGNLVKFTGKYVEKLSSGNYKFTLTNGGKEVQINTYSPAKTFEVGSEYEIIGVVSGFKGFCVLPWNTSLVKKTTPEVPVVVKKDTLANIRNSILTNKPAALDKVNNTYEATGVVSYIYKSSSTTATNFYAYIVDDNGTGLKLSNIPIAFKDTFKIGDLIIAKGITLYSAASSTQASELKLETSVATVVTASAGIPESKATTVDATFTETSFGKLAAAQGRYMGDDANGNPVLTLSNKVKITIENFKFADSTDVKSGLTIGAEYKVPGTVIQYKGYMISVWDKAKIVKTAEPEIVITVNEKTLKETKDAIIANKDTWTSKDITRVYKFDGVISYVYSSATGYFIATDTNGNGIKVINVDTKTKYLTLAKSGDEVTLTGYPYFDPATKEIVVSLKDDTLVTKTAAKGIPFTAATEKTDLLTDNEQGNLVKYVGKLLIETVGTTKKYYVQLANSVKIPIHKYSQKYTTLDVTATKTFYGFGFVNKDTSVTPNVFSTYFLIPDGSLTDWVK